MNFIPSSTLPNYEWFSWSICNGCGMQAENAYPSGHLVPSPVFATCLCSNCWEQLENRFLDFAMSLLDILLWIPLGTFSIVLAIFVFQVCQKRQTSPTPDAKYHQIPPRKIDMVNIVIALVVVCVGILLYHSIFRVTSKPGNITGKFISSCFDIRIRRNIVLSFHFITSRWCQIQWKKLN